jgi:hypothetical protein
VNISEVSLNDKLSAKRDNFGKTCSGVITFLHEIFFEHFTKDNFHVQTFYRTRPDTCYLDNGETQTPGTRHEFLCAIPIYREISYEYDEWSAYGHMDASSAIYMHYHCTTRNTDGKDNRSDYFDLQISYLFKKDSERYGGDRIVYYNHKLFDKEPINLTDHTYFMLYKGVKAVIDDVKLLEEIKKFTLGQKLEQV